MLAEPISFPPNQISYNITSIQRACDDHETKGEEGGLSANCRNIFFVKAPECEQYNNYIGDD
jgi:hypothetical protein